MWSYSIQLPSWIGYLPHNICKPLPQHIESCQRLPRILSQPAQWPQLPNEKRTRILPKHYHQQFTQPLRIYNGFKIQKDTIGDNHTNLVELGHCFFVSFNLLLTLLREPIPQHSSGDEETHSVSAFTRIQTNLISHKQKNHNFDPIRVSYNINPFSSHLTNIISHHEKSQLWPNQSFLQHKLGFLQS